MVKKGGTYIMDPATIGSIVGALVFILIKAALQ